MIQIKRESAFKDKKKDFEYFESWAEKLEKHNQRTYERYEISTSLGKTHIWGLHTKENYIDTLVVFPGARTSSLVWDLDRGLDNFNHKMKVFLVETNGLPNLSNGSTPDIKSLDYGLWAGEVIDKIGVHSNVFVAGASFGGLICAKLGVVRPEKIKAVFLLNPGCLQPFSLSIKNLYYNLLPIIKPTRKNILYFLEQAVLFKPTHTLSAFAEQMLIDYQLFAIKRYKDRTQKPYYMGEELSKLKVDTYLIKGDKDILFPYKNSIRNAEKHIQNLKHIQVFENVGHGIETYSKALNYIGNIIKNTP